MDLSHLSVGDLLKLNAESVVELCNRKILRTKNNPVGDFAEYVISKALKLNLERNSRYGYDAIDKNGKTYQIKARRLTPENRSRQLSGFRNLSEQHFDYLVVVIFESDYSLETAVIAPHSILESYCRFSEHVNSHLLRFEGEILKDNNLVDITKKVAKTMNEIMESKLSM